MWFVEILCCSFLLLHGFWKDSGVQGQSSLPAKILTPVVQSSQGKESRLSCATSKNGEDVSTRIRFCVWERLQQHGRNDHAFLINFNDINSQPGLYSGVAGYSYSGEGFSEGECGIKISFVKTDDFAKWQCTLITDEKSYRGYVDLVKIPEAPSTTTKKPANLPSSSVVAIASSRTAIDDDKPGENGRGGGSGNDFRAASRPIITSYNDARSIIQPEIIVHSTSSNGSPQLIQEVKVESAGLQIKPRRGGKLIVFE